MKSTNIVKDPVLAATAVGRICYEILRLGFSGMEDEKRQTAFDILVNEGGASTHRADVAGHVFYGIDRVDAKEYAEVFAKATRLFRPKIEVTPL